MANIYAVAQEFIRAILRRERAAAVELVKAYGSAYERLSAQIDKLMKKMEKARAAGETIDQACLLREQRYFILLNQVLREIGRFADVTGSVITDQQRRAVNQALADSERLLLAAMEQLPDGIMVEFNRMNKSAVEDLAGFLSDGSPLNTLLGRLARRPGDRGRQSAKFAGELLGRTGLARAGRGALSGAPAVG